MEFQKKLMTFISLGVYQHQMIILNNGQNNNNKNSKGVLLRWMSLNHLLIVLNVNAVISLWTELCPITTNIPSSI